MLQRNIKKKPLKRKIPKRPKIYIKDSITLKSDGQERDFRASTFADPQKRTEIDQLFASQGASISNINTLLTWPLRERIIAISMLAKSKSLEFRMLRGSEPSGSLFDAILTACPDATDLKGFGQWRVVAIEIVAISFPQSLEAPCNKLYSAIKDAGIKGLTVAKLVKEANTLLKEITKASSSGPGGTGAEVKQVWPDAPCSAGLVLPAKWDANANGIPVVGRDGSGFLVPIIITDVRVNKKTHEHFVNLAWKHAEKWVTHFASRETIADNRKIVSLAAYGLPVTSANAGDIVRFLADFEAINATTLPKSEVSSQLGWSEVSGRHVFLLGNSVLSAATSAENKETLNVCFRGADDGDNQLAAAFCSAGTLEGWVEQYSQLTRFPVVVLAVTGSFAAPLLKIVDSGSLPIDLFGETTTGKTTATAYAASVWGNPNPDDPTSLVKTFNSTATCRERTLGVCRDLPAFFDDTQHARDDRDVTAFAYLASQGRGRGRGTVKGIQRQETTRTVTFTNGEKAVTSFAEEGGVFARVLELRNPPFGVRSAEIGDLISKLNDGFRQNYGYAGRAFVQYLLDQADKWEEIRSRFADLKQHYERQAGENMFGRRLAPSLAVLHLTAQLVHDALGLPGEAIDPVAPLLDELINQAAQADRPEAALKLAIEWAHSRLTEFAKNGHTDSENPPRVCLGNLTQYSVPADDGSEKEIIIRHIQFIPHILKNILEEAGFSYNATLQSWNKRGWLKVHNGDGNRHTVKSLINGETTRLVSIDQRAYENACRQ